MEQILIPEIEVGASLLMRLDCAVIEGPPEAAFITSDTPCVWADPEGYKRAPFYQGPALVYKSIEITLPVSPRQMIVLNRQGHSRYFYAPPHAVDEFNRRTRFACSEYFVSNSNVLKPIWLDPGVEPEDSWRKRHPQRRRVKPPRPMPSIGQ